MILFIDDKPIRIYPNKEKNLIAQEEDFQSIIDAGLGPIKSADFKGNTLILNFNKDLVEKLLEQLHQGLTNSFSSLTILTSNFELVKKSITQFYDIVKASGGMVLNEKGEILFIFRLGKWDLPKGKKEKGENSKDCAKREIKEECNVDAKVGNKICTTYHTYSMRGKRVLKKTKWFWMEGKNEKLIPQTEEGIEKVEWKNPDKLQDVLLNTYSSIRYVIQVARVNQSKSSIL